MRGITILLLLLTGIIFILGGGELVMTKDYWILLGLFYGCCFVIWFLFGDIIDSVAGVNKHKDDD